MSIKNRFFTSTMPGMTGMGYSPGTLVNNMKKVLVDGSASVALTSIVIAANKAKAYVSDTALFKQAVVEITGSGVVGVDGTFRITATGTGWFEYDVTGVADQTITGALSFRYPSLGWSQIYFANNTLVVRHANAAKSQPYYRISDNENHAARAMFYETMTDINTGTYPVPAHLAVSGGVGWPKNSHGSGSRNWVMFGNDEVFYYLSFHYYGYSCLVGMGLFKPREGYNDQYTNFIAGAENNDNFYSDVNRPSLTYTPDWGVYFERDAFDIYRSVAGLKAARYHYPTNGYAGTSGTEFVNKGNNEILLGEVNLFELGVLRGELKGVEFCLQSMPAGIFSNLEVVDLTINSVTKPYLTICDTEMNRGIFLDLNRTW